MGRRPVVALLDRRVRLHPKARYEPEGPVLWVRRKNPAERLFARILQKGEPRIRLRLDERGALIFGRLVALDGPTGRVLAESVGIPADDAAVAKRDPELAAFLVYLRTLERGGAIMTEPI